MRKLSLTLKALTAFAVGAFLLSCNKDNNTPAPAPGPAPEPELNFETDSLALIAFYNASDGANWKAANKWDITKPVDTWKGVKVDTNETTGIRRVVEFKMATGTVLATADEWTMPDEIGNLRELTIFQCEKCRLTGNLPDGIYNLKKLQRLQLNNNNIKGSFSDRLGDLTELIELRILASADFGGTIPQTIGNLKKLESISLSQTKIGGAIPATLAGCTNLKQFMAFSCQLSGQLPDIWDQFHNDFSILMIYGNEGLTGPLPASIGSIQTNSATLALQLYNCNFTGGIPAAFATIPAACKQLFLDGNKLEGEIPAAVVAHVNYNTWKTHAQHPLLNQQPGYVLTEPEPNN